MHINKVPRLGGIFSTTDDERLAQKFADVSYPKQTTATYKKMVASWRKYATYSKVGLARYRALLEDAGTWGLVNLDSRAAAAGLENAMIAIDGGDFSSTVDHEPITPQVILDSYAAATVDLVKAAGKVTKTVVREAASTTKGGLDALSLSPAKLVLIAGAGLIAYSVLNKSLTAALAKWAK